MFLYMAILHSNLINYSSSNLYTNVNIVNLITVALLICSIVLAIYILIITIMEKQHNNIFYIQIGLLILYFIIWWIGFSIEVDSWQKSGWPN